MLTSENLPTIEFAVQRRLDQEPGVFVFLPMNIRAYRRGDWYQDRDSGLDLMASVPFIRVEALIRLEDFTCLDPLQNGHLWARFDLPDPFEHGHLLNEIDEIAEQCKAARKGDTMSSLVSPVRKLPGTGLRGRWDRYGTLMAKNG